jgi:hypothetical protein
MNKLLGLGLGLMGALVPFVAGADQSGLSADAVAAHAASVANISTERAQKRAQWEATTRAAHTTRAIGATGTAVTSATLPGLPFSNAARVYPPSCASYPLPDTPTNILYTGAQNLYARNADGSPAGIETDQITFWQLPCSSSGATTPYNLDGGANALTLMRIDRGSSSGNAGTFPTFPSITAAQEISGVVYTNFARSAIEPNTVVAEAPYDSPVIYSTTYVLESYPYDGEYIYYDYNFQLTVNPYDGNSSDELVLSFPAYAPATGAGNNPIDGFLSTAWYDPTHSGEGMFVDVFESGADTIFTTAWYTYDQLALPFWLLGQATVPAGATSLSNVPVYYYTGGGFAGDFGANSGQLTWGTMDVSFPDCNHMNFSFSGSTDSATAGPSGSGAREWQRLANVNGLSCE